MKKKIAIQGFEGSFHQFAAEKYFDKNINILCCSTFRDVISLAQDKTKTDAALMAIENSIAGSILPNYTLLKNSKLKVTGEIYLQIKQQFISNKNVKLSDITEVHSHPIAILQCWSFLEKYNWKIVETEDTALSIKHISENKYKNIAGIGSIIAADIFNMKILVKNINSMKENFTRFLILEREENVILNKKANKSSVCFSLVNKRGSLAQVLTRIHYHGINLTKLQSFPQPGSKWEYYFHSDMEFDKLEDFYKVLDDIKNITNDIKVYGIYEKGKTI